MADDTNVSVIIIYSFFFLFIVFLLLQQGEFIPSTTGYALLDITVFENLTNLSLTTLIIIVAGLIILIVGGIFLYKKLKKKKEANLEIPVAPQPTEKDIGDLNKEFNVPQTETQENVMNQDINKLFSQDQNQKITQEVIKKRPEKEKVDFNQLRQLIKSLMNKNYTKESIVKYLINKGYNMMLIRNAIYSINQENLSRYIKNSLSQGFSKKDVMDALLRSGWNKEDILKYFSQ
ncbi:MAG: hypothetical protein AABW45_00905 [Nanoarchaeota archaeon]